MSSVIARIQQTQVRLAAKNADQLSLNAPPQHKPEILLIGCVDARLDIIADLGIPKGKALVYRNVAALVQGMADAADHSHMSETAALEFAINIMKVKDIIVLGHTDCGGIKACLAEGSPGHKGMDHYLTSLDDVRQKIVAGGGDVDAQAHAMERAAVQQSIDNLQSYYVVKDALRDKRLSLHGWVINTATGAIVEIAKV